ncbi:MAG: FhaA domain-containing protein, partial [Dehalococcoidia bacterium]
MQGRCFPARYNGAMRALARLESILQDIMERPQWLLAPKRVHPLELANAITRAFEDGVLPVGDRVIAPNQFTVGLYPDDFEQLGPVRPTLERELALYVARAAQERGLSLSSPPDVRLTASDRVKSGGVDVAADFAAAPKPAPAAATLHGAPSPLLAGFTERIQSADLPPAPATAARAALELLADDDRVLHVFPLEGQIVTIGRRSGNDIALMDP